MSHRVRHISYIDGREFSKAENWIKNTSRTMTKSRCLSWRRLTSYRDRSNLMMCCHVRIEHCEHHRMIDVASSTIHFFRSLILDITLNPRNHLRSLCQEHLFFSKKLSFETSSKYYLRTIFRLPNVGEYIPCWPIPKTSVSASLVCFPFRLCRRECLLASVS